jgi:hypothetical protein
MAVCGDPTLLGVGPYQREVGSQGLGECSVSFVNHGHAGVGPARVSRVGAGRESGEVIAIGE